MGSTIIEKILENHSGEKNLKPGMTVDIEIDARIARDFGGANVVKNLRENNLELADTSKTFFTFDCNPGGSDQKYAANQHVCRLFARERGMKIYDIDSGIGTHIAIDSGLVLPGETLVSTDSHANILGAIGAFGQGMGDQDIACAFATGKTWFKVPKSMKIILEGKREAQATAKDIGLCLLKHFGANGLLGYSAEIYGDSVDAMSLSDRITISSLVTEMGGIIALFPPNDEVINYGKEKSGREVKPVFADKDAHYDKVENISIAGVGELISRPGHPEDVTLVKDLPEIKVDSVFIGSCTNGRYDDLKKAAEVFRGKKVAPGVVAKIVPSTREVYKKLLEEGLIKVFSDAGCLVGNPGCAGCAAGQIGQNGPKEITISTGNRNFVGKQGRGEVYLASPETAAASAISGVIRSVDNVLDTPKEFETGIKSENTASTSKTTGNDTTVFEGRVWVIDVDNIDTDMIYHNRYLAITEMSEMGQYAFDNLQGWEDFAKKVKKNDIIITGKNFGCGSSRQQAVDCFKALGVTAIVANSFGAIYERNAINAAMPIISFDQELKDINLKDGDKISLNLTTSEIKDESGKVLVKCNPFSKVQMDIYQRGGLLQK